MLQGTQVLSSSIQGTVAWFRAKRNDKPRSIAIRKMTIGGLGWVIGWTPNILLWVPNLALLPDNVHAEDDDYPASRCPSHNQTLRSQVLTCHLRGHLLRCLRLQMEYPFNLALFVTRYSRSSYKYREGARFISQGCRNTRSKMRSLPFALHDLGQIFI